MSRELILIPKLKYERLMNDVKQARKDDEEKEHSTADTIQSATDKKLSNHDKQSPPKGTIIIFTFIYINVVHPPSVQSIVFKCEMSPIFVWLFLHASSVAEIVRVSFV
jgi:hypothetical protein